MEFFKSKYYTPTASDRCDTPSGALQNHKRVVIRDIGYISNSKKMIIGSMANAILDRYTDTLATIKNYRVDYNHVKATWTRVVDLQGFSGKYDTVVNNAEDIKSLVGETYFHPGTECFMVYDRYRASVRNPHLMSTGTIRAPFMVNREGIFEALVEDGSIIKHTPPKRARIGVLIQDRNGFGITYNDLPPLNMDISLMYGEGFNVVSDRIVECVSNPEYTGLIILHGEPGTGKTSYIKWLSGVATRHMVFVPPDMVEALTKPAFIDFLLENRGLTFIVEDAEASLSPRLGSSNSIVSSILNLSNGILGDILQSQFICTFNTPLTNIDSALLRPGRLLVKHEFNKLSTEEANRYLKSIDSDFIAKGPMSLAELTNLDTAPVVSTEKVKPSFGFNTNR